MSERGTTAQHRVAPWRRALGALGIDLRPGEGGVALLLFFCFFLFITFQYATKSVRQSTFIDGRGAAELPWVYLSVALVSYPFLLLYSRLASRLQRHRLMVGTSLVIGVSMVACWWLFQYSWPWLPYAFYVWISLVYVMIVSQFWLFAAHVLDPRQAKRLFGFVGAGGLLGGIAGGQVATLVARVADTRSTFIVAAAILVAGAALIQQLHRRHPGVEEPAAAAAIGKLDKARGGFAILRGSRHLRFIAAIVVLTTIVAQIVDFQFSWAVQQATSNLDERTAFFGNFFSIMGISAFVFQVLFTSRIHRRLGIGVALRASPVTMGLGTGLLFVAAGFGPAAMLTAAIVLKVGENGLRYSLDQATRELLFLPVPAQTRMKAKAFIDVFVARGAKGLGALVLLPVTFGLMTALQSGWITLGLIAVWLAVTFWAYREYVRSFRRSLKERTVDAAAPVNLADVTTLEILVQSLGSADRRQVLHALEILAANGRAALVTPLLLYHDDAEVRRRTLEVLAQAERRDAVDLIERRLGDSDAEVRAEAVRVLAALLGRDASDLMESRLDDPNPEVRAAAIAALATHGDEALADRASRALKGMLSDADPALRCAAAQAISAVPEPRFGNELLMLLYDPDARVALAGINAVRLRAERDGANPLYVPTLISQLGSRRAKHESREALVACGVTAIPLLCYFLASPDEALWVRRALPKTLARLGNDVAARTLVACLDVRDDAFLRRKLIEALGSLDRSLLGEGRRRAIAREIAAEAAGYLGALGQLVAVGLPEGSRVVGPLIRCDGEEASPNLLHSLLAERLEDHLRNLFGLLSLLHPERDVWAAYHGLTSGEPGLASRALEYLDNLLAGDVRRDVFAVVGDLPLPDRLQAGRKLFGIALPQRQEALAGMLTATRDGADARDLSVSALYLVHTERLEPLYAAVRALAAAAVDPLVAETAAWVAARHGEATTR
ncbi:MAG: Npt1/Npt2 family nucleotide transporter [Thermoanaerobaculia bacterium]